MDGAPNQETCVVHAEWESKNSSVVLIRLQKPRLVQELRAQIQASAEFFVFRSLGGSNYYDSM